MNKFVFCLLALSLSTVAHASYFQDYCSNAEGTVRTGSGHSKNFTVVTERTWSEESGEQMKPVELGWGEAEVEQLSEQILENKSSKQCHGQYGIGYWSQVSYVNVRITKRDGSLFSQDTLGVTEDLKAVEAKMICEHSGNSMILCDEPETETPAATDTPVEPTEPAQAE